MLTAGIDGVDDVAAVSAQHAALVGHVDVGDAPAHGVHRAGTEAPQRVVVPLEPHAADVVVALVHLGEQLADLLRRILQVRVQRDDALAAAALEARHDRHVLAEIAVQQDHAGDLRAPRELLAQQSRRAVAAAVVDEDHLVADAETVERRIQASEERRQPGFLVVHGNDDGKPHDSALRTAAHTRDTSDSVIAGNSGSVTIERPTRSACGNWPARQPSERYRANRCIAG